MAPRRTPRPGWWLAAAPCMLLLAAWAVGQVVRDRWLWSQFLFWIPAPIALVLAVGTTVFLRRARSPWSKRLALLSSAIGAAALAMAARWDIGWGFPAVPGAHAITVMHWNPRWPGEASLEYGRALGAASADVYVISNPGAMARADVASDWVPEGWTVVDRGPVAVVSRVPVKAVRLLAYSVTPAATALWLAWVEVEVPGGGTLRILGVDLPSDPRVSRSGVAQALRQELAKYPELPAPDLLVGDFNNVPRSVVFDALPAASIAPPWRASGWMDTFPRRFPMFRIDSMRVAPGWEFLHSEALDLGVGIHLAQRSVIAPRAP